MAVKLADTLAPLGDFAIAEAKDVDVIIGDKSKRLQKAIEDGDIGGGGVSGWKGSPAEFEALDKSTLSDGEIIYLFGTSVNVWDASSESLVPVVDQNAGIVGLDRREW